MISLGIWCFLAMGSVVALLLPILVSARLTIPELPQLEGVDPELGPLAVFEGIVTYFVYLCAGLFIVWVLLVVGQRVIGEFNAARRDTGDFGRVLMTAFVGMGTTLFVVFLANYVISIVQ